MKNSTYPKTMFCVAWLILVLLIVYLYWPAIQGELVWDDSIIVGTHRIFDREEWFHNSFRHFYLVKEYYRPLPILTMMLNGLWGEKLMPLLGHSTNIFIFCANILLVMLLVWHVASNQVYAAIFAGSFYAVHPALLESVSWISGRCDLLVTFFILLALFVDLKLKFHPAWRIAAVCLCFFGAALSKEMAVTFPAVWFIWRLYIEDVPFTIQGLYLWLTRSHNRLFLVALFATGLAYLLFRFYMLDFMVSLQRGSADVRDFGGALNRLVLVGKTFTWYVLLQIFPHYDLSAAYPSAYPVALQDRAGLLGVFMLLVSMLLICSSRLNAKIKYILIINCLLFLPISNIRPLSSYNNIINLRLLMLPVSCGIVLITPIFLDWVFGLRKKLQVIILVVGVAWWVSSVANLSVTVKLWSRDVYLWGWITETKPYSWAAWDNYASALSDLHDYQGCIEVEKKSLAYTKDKLRPYVTIATCYNSLGDRQQASVYASEAKKMTGSVYASEARKKTASFWAEKDAYSSLLTLLALWEVQDWSVHKPSDKKQYDHVVDILSEAIRIDPYNIHPPILLLLWCILNNDDYLAFETARLLYLRKFDIELVRQKIKTIVALSKDDSSRLEKILMEADNATKEFVK